MKNLLKMAVAALALSCSQAYSILQDDFPCNSQKSENIRKIASVNPLICSFGGVLFLAEKMYGGKASTAFYDVAADAYMVYMTDHRSVYVPADDCHLERTIRRLFRQMISEKKFEEARQIAESLKQLAEELEQQIEQD